MQKDFSQFLSFVVSWTIWKWTNYYQSEDKREESKYFQDKIAAFVEVLYLLHEIHVFYI